MNLRETIISSFFFHLILFLLVAAAAQYTTGVLGGVQNIVSVDLSVDERKAPPPEPKSTPPAEKESRDSRPPLKEEMTLPARPAEHPPEEEKKTETEKSGAEKKADVTPEPAIIEHAQKPPVQREGFTSQEAYYQFIMLHRQIFGQKAGGRVNELLGEALKLNKREFFGGTGIVTLKFGPDQKLSGILVDSASPELKSFLEEMGWDAVPAPAAYLGHTVQIEFTVLEGSMSFRINTL